MITHTRQRWEVGSTVKVGFLTLVVLALIPTPGDFAPDQYRLRDGQTGREYLFTPHRGLQRVPPVTFSEKVTR